MMKAYLRAARVYQRKPSHPAYSIHPSVNTYRTGRLCSICGGRGWRDGGTLGKYDCTVCDNGYERDRDWSFLNKFKHKEKVDFTPKEEE